MPRLRQEHNQYEWNRKTFHGGIYYVKNFVGLGQGRISKAGNDWVYETYEFSEGGLDLNLEGTVPTLREAQLIVDSHFDKLRC